MTLVHSQVVLRSRSTWFLLPICLLVTFLRNDKTVAGDERSAISITESSFLRIHGETIVTSFTSATARCTRNIPAVISSTQHSHNSLVCRRSAPAILSGYQRKTQIPTISIKDSFAWEFRAVTWRNGKTLGNGYDESLEDFINEQKTTTKGQSITRSDMCLLRSKIIISWKYLDQGSGIDVLLRWSRNYCLTGSGSRSVFVLRTSARLISESPLCNRGSKGWRNSTGSGRRNFFLERKQSRGSSSGYCCVNAIKLQLRNN